MEFLALIGAYVVVRRTFLIARAIYRRQKPGPNHLFRPIGGPRSIHG